MNFQDVKNMKLQSQLHLFFMVRKKKGLNSQTHLCRSKVFSPLVSGWMRFLWLSGIAAAAPWPPGVVVALLFYLQQRRWACGDPSTTPHGYITRQWYLRLTDWVLWASSSNAARERGGWKKSSWLFIFCLFVFLCLSLNQFFYHSFVSLC